MSSCWPDACPSGYARTSLGFKGNSRGRAEQPGLLEVRSDGARSAPWTDVGLRMDRRRPASSEPR